MPAQGGCYRPRPCCYVFLPAAKTCALATMVSQHVVMNAHESCAAGEANILPLFTLHYDFDPVLCDDPIASVTCQTRESSVDLKTYLALRR